jgi:hypothetical protein
MLLSGVDKVMTWHLALTMMTGMMHFEVVVCN